MRKFDSIFAVALLAVISGCMNMATSPDQITGGYVSTVRYDQYDCGQLTREIGFIRSREAVMVSAQNARVYDSQVQAFWWGVGKGDGVEAFELSRLRGEETAVTYTMLGKGCEVPPKPVTIVEKANTDDWGD